MQTSLMIFVKVMIFVKGKHCILNIVGTLFYYSNLNCQIKEGIFIWNKAIFS